MVRIPRFAVIAVATFTLAQGADNAPVLLDPKPTKARAKQEGRLWKLSTAFAVQFESNEKIDFFLTAPGKGSQSTAVTPSGQSLQYVTATADIQGNLPGEVYLSSAPAFGSPVRLQVTRSDADAAALDWMLSLAAAISLAAVGLGVRLAGKSLWLDLGSQTFTFKSWATNASVGGGVLGLIVAVLPGADSVYAVLSAILGAVAGFAPIAYNFSTRNLNGIQKGKVLAFAIAAVFTGISSLGLIQIAYTALGQMDAPILPPVSLCILRAIVIGSG